MSNTNTSYQAAGEHATAARQEVKAWYKRPLALNATITVAVILTALWLNATFSPLNLFWKLLLGAALVWGGGKMVETKTSVAGFWGKVSKGLGFAIIVVALLHSGVRHATESMVDWADKTLTELSGKDSEGKQAAKVPKGTTVPVPFPTFKGKYGYSTVTGAWGDTFEASFPVGKPNTGMAWGICKQIIRPAKVPVKMESEWTGNHRSKQTTRFTDASQIALMTEYHRLGVTPTSIQLQFVYLQVPLNTTDVCAVYLSEMAG